MSNEDKTIEILWKGPYSPGQVVAGKDIEYKNGLYQIYGTHTIYGRGVLLYIGQTNGSFSKRIKSHYDQWIKYEFDEVEIYLGKIWKSTDVGNESENSLLEAEKLLIYFCAPAYNSNDIVDYKKPPKDSESVTIMNFGKISSLPTVVSSKWYHADIWEDREIWK